VLAIKFTDTALPTFGELVAVNNEIEFTVDCAFAAAVAETTESIPNPIDATATSATRLKVVFVDICFLSISQDQEFPELGFG
jgi:hypothetical protein